MHILAQVKFKTGHISISGNISFTFSSCLSCIAALSFPVQIKVINKPFLLYLVCLLRIQAVLVFSAALHLYKRPFGKKNTSDIMPQTSRMSNNLTKYAPLDLTCDINSNSTRTLQYNLWATSGQKQGQHTYLEENTCSDKEHTDCIWTLT